MTKILKSKPSIAAVDLFCGAGGLTYGLRKAGIDVVAGIDIDPACEYPYTANNDAKYITKDVRQLTADDLAKLYPEGSIRLLAGCAPCQPFSAYSHGNDNTKHDGWGLLVEFGRLVEELKPELVTMENVPGLGSKVMFKNFVEILMKHGYIVDYKSVYCPKLGIPQQRRRLVLLASLLGEIKVPAGSLKPIEYKTVRDTIAALPKVKAGETDPADRLHRARAVNDINLKRLRSSLPGGTWKDWPIELLSPCHKKITGASYQSVYSRMVWDQPSPTITTQAYNFGTGRFGHPIQDRSLTLREAALLQTFPRKYRFVAPHKKISLANVGRLIGNSVPPKLAYHIGRELLRVASVVNIQA